MKITVSKNYVTIKQAVCPECYEKHKLFLVKIGLISPPEKYRCNSTCPFCFGKTNNIIAISKNLTEI